MAGVKISALPPVASSQLSDVFPVVQAGVTSQETLSQVATLFNANLTFLPLAGGTMSGAINMGSHQINSVLNPTSAQDAATKSYVDSIATGGAAPCVCATTANLTATQAGAGVGATLTNSGSQAAFSVDGITPTILSRILVKNQIATANNGIYILTNAGSGATNWVLTRATDYDTPTDINDTGVIPVVSGTVNANTGWINTTVNVAVDTTAITFVQFGASYPVSLANGGTGAALTASNGGIFYSTATAGAILSGTATAQQLLTSGSSTAPVWSTSTYPLTNAINTLLYASGANTMAALATANNSILVTSSSGVPSLAAVGTALAVASSVLKVSGSLLNIQAITSTSTYTPTSGTTNGIVFCTGGGGGGGGYGAPTAVGGTGGTTSFGLLCSATGGVGGAGATVGGAGGVGSSGTFNLTGAGGGASTTITAGVGGASGVGGSSFFGGGAAAQFSGAGTNGVTNSGGGGSGASGTTAGLASSGGGGGGTAVLFVSGLASTSCTIGAAGTAGTASVSNGGAGGSGVILIFEFA